MKKLRMFFSVVFLFSIVAFVSFPGCSSLPSYTYCVDIAGQPVKRGDVVDVGTITEYKEGEFFKTVCLTVDLTKLEGFNGNIGEIVYIEVLDGNGKLGKPGDESIYNIYTVHNELDGFYKTSATVRGSAISSNK